MKPNSRTLAIVKLGGSTFTEAEGSIDLNNLQILCKEIAQSEYPLILVHGGGYFIKKILLDNKVRTDLLSSSQAPLANYLRKSLAQLNTYVLRKLRDVGVHAIPIPMHSVSKYSNGQIVADASMFNSVEIAIKNKELPVLFGDVLDDENGGYYFASSDKTVSILASILKPHMVLFVSNVDGVYDKYPPRASDTILSTLTPKFLRRLDDPYSVGHGEMRDKLVEAIYCAQHADICRIINGKVPGNLITSLRDIAEIGTTILPEETS